MVWGGIWWDGRTGLILCEQTIDTEYCCEIIAKGLLDLQLPPKQKLLQDNAPVHKAKLTQEFLRQVEFELV